MVSPALNDQITNNCKFFLNIIEVLDSIINIVLSKVKGLIFWKDERRILWNLMQ